MSRQSSGTRRAGLALLALVSLGDAVSLALTDGETPPYAVAALATVLGVVSLWLVVRAWRDPSAPVRALVALRVLSAVTALPAFLVDDVPPPAVGAAAAAVAVTTAGVLLLTRPTRRASEVAL